MVRIRLLRAFLTASVGLSLLALAAPVSSSDQPNVEPEISDCANLVQDPSFEEYTPNPYWDEASSLYGTPLCKTEDCGGEVTAFPRTGLVWAWFGGVKVDEIASLAQPVTIPDGLAALEFYFWIGAAGLDSGTDDTFQARIDGVPVFASNATQKSLYPQYTRITVNISNFADGGSHMLSFSSNTTQQLVTFNLDDVTLCGFEVQSDQYLPVISR